MDSMGHSRKPEILIIDDEPEIGRLFSKILSDDGYRVCAALSGEQGIIKIRKKRPDLVFLDLKLPGKNGIEILRVIRKIDRELQVVILTGYETVKTAVEAMKLGAYDYLSKPVDIAKIKLTIKNALYTYEMIKSVAPFRKARDFTYFESIVGRSPQIKTALKLVRKVASYDVTVLIRGESGTGKELVAREIHKKSFRANKPFITIDCAVLPETLIESEIFGHEKGAYTGAHTRKIGKFEMANRGTVFIDEIGNLSANTQVKLLRTIQEREIERLGGKSPIKVDIRLITATHIDLEKAIESGKFREDLYYRMNVFLISLPALREREGDVLLLAEYFLERFNRIFNKEVKDISPRAQMLMEDYSWPGNVRELQNVIESAVILARETIRPQHLPARIQENIQKKIEPAMSLREVGKLAQRIAEKELILKVLQEVRGNKSKASRMLKIDYKTLYNRLKEFNIKDV